MSIAIIPAFEGQLGRGATPFADRVDRPRIVAL